MATKRINHIYTRKKQCCVIVIVNKMGHVASGFLFSGGGVCRDQGGSWRSAWFVIPWPLIITCAVLLIIIIYDVKINYCFGKWTKFRIELKDLNCNITKMIRETLCLDKKKSISSRGRCLFHKGIENDFNRLLKLLNSSFI